MYGDCNAYLHIEASDVLIKKTFEVYIKCKDPVSHLENCKHYFYMILLQ